MRDLAPLIERVLPAATALRHVLHANPELALEEHATAAAVAERLRALPGMAVRTGVGGTGVVATLDAGRLGPCVLLRADMDALPLTEATGLPYASRVPGRAHACGHDGHTACLVGAATVLASLGDELPGPVRFVFQPAEEQKGGGRLVVADGALDDPPVAAAFALHAWPGLPIGRIGVRAGPAMAATDGLVITVRGCGTHAAAPHRGADPILAAAHVVTALQSVVSRTIDPSQPAVLTIARIEGGTTNNVIPECVTLGGTLRTITAGTRDAAMAAIRRVATHAAQALGAEAEVTLNEGYPVLVNDPAAAAYVAATGRDVLGAGNVHEVAISLGGEDFAYYLQRVPGALWRLGVMASGTDEVVPLHSPRFDFPDAALAVGIRLHVELVRRFHAGALASVETAK